MASLFRFQLIILGIQLIMGVWARFFPVRTIANPAKKLAVGCCYHSRRAAASQKAWDYAQQRFGRWCLVLLLPSAAVSFAAAALLSRLEGLAPMVLALLVPLLFFVACRALTERDIKRQNFGDD